MVRLWCQRCKFYLTVSSDFTNRTALCIVTRNSCVVLTADCSLFLMHFAWKFPVVQTAPYPIHSISFQFYTFHYLPLCRLYLSCISVTTDTQYSRPLNLSWPNLHPPTFVTLITKKPVPAWSKASACGCSCRDCQGQPWDMTDDQLATSCT